MDHARIFAIACELKPVWEKQETAFQRVLNETNASARYDDWLASVEVYNASLMAYVPELASITNNSTTNIRMVLRPTMLGDVGASPDFLRNVAQYDSFNSKLWTKYSGLEREPTRVYEFP